MIIAHLADLHLGYRAYHRVTARGINAREWDVSEAFRHAVDAVAEMRPDLVLVAGDVFHTVRPSNAAIADAFRLFSSLTTRLPGVPVVMIAGNHDSPRSSDTGNILSLFREIPRIHVVTEEAERVLLPDLEAAVLCLPHNALARRWNEDAAPAPAFEVAPGAPAEAVLLDPDPAVATNLLMLHGTVSGSAAEGKIRYVSEYGGVAVSDTEIGPDRWDYVALGHYHLATELATNMWYAGGIERTSTNIWMEAEAPKGFVRYDTVAGRASFQPLPSRPVVDLERVSARGRTAAEIDEAIRAAVEAVPGGIEGKMVRLVLTDLPRHAVRELNHRRIRELKAEALHFHLDARPPEVHRVIGSGAPMRRQTLREQVEGYLTREWTPTSPEIDRDRLVALARGYLDGAGEGVE